MKKITLVLIGMFFIAGICSAKDLSKKAGIGFNSQLSGHDVNSLSIRYWFSKKIAVEGLIGFSLGDDVMFDMGGKFLSVLKEEQNLNIYAFGLLGMESTDIDDNNPLTDDDDTGITAGAGFGAEFFLIGLDNLGFGAEIGFGFNNADDKSQFGTSAGWLSSVGIRYYLKQSEKKEKEEKK
ncbi:MAG: hypothetical protein JW983_05365 [Elusimicrobia bacterium]|nr:hypothetical protein [Elusimicrobiota bacterium]